MAKEFYTSGIGSAQTLSPSDESKIKIYPTEAALDADLANLEEDEIVATDEDNNPASGTQYPVDVVQDGNMHAVTSNAVFSMVKSVEYTGTTGADGMLWGAFGSIDVSKVLSVIVITATGKNTSAVISNSSSSGTTYGIKLFSVNAGGTQVVAEQSVTVKITYLDIQGA